MKYVDRAKIFGCFIALLLIISTFTSVGIKETLTHELDAYDEFNNEPNLNKENVEVLCSTYGIGQHDTEQNVIMSQAEAELILEKIQAYSLLIVKEPQSREVQALQEEIINLAIEYDLVPKETLLNIRKMRLPKQKILPKIRPNPMSTANEWFCNYAAGGEGGATSVIIFPRLTPILLFPIPRLFYRWNARIGFASCGGLRSRTGFMASGEQTGTAIGFWGIGFSVFLPPVMAFGIIGYAIYCSVEAEHIEYWPPNYPPDINPVFPLDESINIPISTSELSFYIDDYENELMSYSVTTDPDVGTGTGNLKPDGTYHINIHGLEGTETYYWIVQVSDGPNTVEETFSFTTESVAPIISNPVPEDDAYLISVDLPELQFYLSDPQGDLMDFTVETSPNIGSDSKTGVYNGVYSIPITDLDYLTTYRWYVNATDGIHTKHKIFTFQTEMMMEFNPFNEGWQYRKNITIDHTKVTGDLTNYPMLIHLHDADLRDKTQTTGNDILFMDGLGNATRLFHETEHYDEVSGELIAWVNIPFLSSTTDTQICIYYGNPLCDDQQFPIYVWDDNYKAIWHMTDELDSTANNNHLTNYGALPGYQGKIHTCYKFDGLDDHMTFPDLVGSGKPITYEIWGQINGPNSANYYAQSFIVPYHETREHLTFTNEGFNDIAPFSFYSDYHESSGAQFVDTGANSVNYGTLYHVVSQLDETGTATIYLNGQQKESKTGIGTISSHNLKNTIGSYVPKNGPMQCFLNGYIDEIRISTYARPSNWISTEYNNQNNPTSFYTIGPEETG